MLHVHTSHNYAVCNSGLSSKVKNHSSFESGNAVSTW